MEKILEGLNPEQKEAITTTEGPVLIIAGAGTGKTTVITRKIAWLIANNLARPSEILALTFTDKAAQEMQERVDILVPYGFTDVWISTFHAFGDRILRENALELGLPLDFRVITQAESAVLIREHIFEFKLEYFRPLSEPTRFVNAFVSFFSRARDEDVSAQEYSVYAKKLFKRSKENPQDLTLREEARKHLELAKAYKKYLEILEKKGLVDFANQFYLALKLLREHPSILNKYQKQFKYILVDEFQDTNFAQFQMVKLLAGENKNITVVADDDQCIYRWRGAAYSNVLNFMESFPEAKKINLIRNYRSGQAILDSAYRLIQHNNPERFEVKAKINKRLIANTQGQPPKHFHFDSYLSEADYVAKFIKEKVESKKYKYGDFAILVRSNSDAEPFLQALNMQGIPWQFSAGAGLYERPEIKLCINFLRVIYDPLDSVCLYFLAVSEIYNLEALELTQCSHYAKRKNLSLYEVLRNIKEFEELKDLREDFLKKVDFFLGDIHRYIKLSKEISTGNLLYSFLTESGYLKRLVENPSLENEIKIQNLAKFFNLVRQFSSVIKEDRVFNFVPQIDLLIEAGDDPETSSWEQNADLVNVLTVHKAKGLEFRVVFLVSLVQGRFPWPNRPQAIEFPEELIKEILPSGDFHIQEERRLFYVGMTRAKEELYFTSADNYGGTKSRKISQFIVEALGKEAVAKEVIKQTPLEAIEKFIPSSGITEVKEPSIREVTSLSYYQIDDYLTCPLKYKFVHIQHVPIAQHHTVIYGKAMHSAISIYFQYKLAGKKMSLRELLKKFESEFKAEGFLDKRHFLERLKLGRESLKRFYETEEKKNPNILFVEKDFLFSFDNIKITGRFDRVDLEKDGAVIIDFKTSQVDNQKEANERTKESLQLRLYSFAYESIFGVLPKKVRLYFLESDLIGEAEINHEDIEKLKDNIRNVVKGIKEGKFSAKPIYLACNYCAYNRICPSVSRN